MLHQCFVRWFLIFLSYLTVVFFAAYEGFISAVWHGDVTHITSLIAIIFVVGVAHLGVTSWHIEENKTKAAANTQFIHTITYVITLIGLLGTAIGLSLQVKAMGSLDLSQTEHVTQFILAVASSLSTALYSTISGIVGSVGLTLMNSNVEYYLDSHDETEPS